MGIKLGLSADGGFFDVGDEVLRVVVDGGVALVKVAVVPYAVVIEVEIDIGGEGVGEGWAA